MKIQNMEPDVCAYEIFPCVALRGAPTAFTARGLGSESALTPGRIYRLRIIGQEENNSSLLLDISDWTKYPGCDAAADAEGVLHFSYTFTREQIYSIRLAEQGGDGAWKPIGEFRIFCAEEDLYYRTPLRGNTHCHVCPSVDGHEDPFLAAAIYRKAGYDFLAITDHHLIDGSKQAIASAERVPNDLLLFYGEEVHVPNAYIHAVNVGAVFPGGIGLDRWYHENEEKCLQEVRKIADESADLPEGVEPMDFAFRKWIADRIHERGGAAILAHPFWEWDAHNTRDDVFRFFAEKKIYDAAEILHGQEPGCRDAALQLAFWNDMRAQGIYISPLGADDAHRRNFRWDYDSSFNEVWSVVFAKESSFKGFAEALRSGYTAAVETYEDAPEHFAATYRLTKYVCFLLDRYYPFHDELCFEEGRLMREAYLGDAEALLLLQRLRGRVRRFNRMFFGREDGERG
ncbi:MAG: hypothetical protein IJL26_10240 [Clostridia bacterium]|nr:hypothetical protein [Clostridia bacterium]